MAKGLYHHLSELWKKPRESFGEVWKQRLIEWRRTDSVVKVEKPLRLDRARALGYKAKKGFVTVRVRVKRGGRKRPDPTKKGRRSKRQTIRKVIKMNYRWVAEQRSVRKYKNLEVLNSYWIAKDGQHYWYEVLLVDPNAPEIKSDKHLGWISKGNRKRVYRGLTSAGRKSRGLRNKGRGAEKARPSRRAQSAERSYKKSRAK